MAFDSTLSGTAANSYITTAQADDYFSLRHESSLYPKGTAAKQRLLVTATRRLDAEMFTGYKTDDDQVLMFPRTGLLDRNGTTVIETTIPQNLINAICEMVYFILQEDERMMGDEMLHDMDNLTGFSGTIDGMAVNYSIRAGAKANKLPQKVQTELKAIGPGVWKAGTLVTNLTR